MQRIAESSRNTAGTAVLRRAREYSLWISDFGTEFLLGLLAEVEVNFEA